MKNAIRDIEKVVLDGGKHAQEAYPFESFKARNADYKLAVIDGSNHSIRGMNFTFAALRTGYHIYHGGEKIDESVDPITVELLANHNDPDIGFEKKFETYYKRVVGEKPVGYPEFDKTPERIRTLCEWQKLIELIDRLDAGDVIVFDGTLISGVLTTTHAFFNGLADRARAKGITLVGLSKDTSLSIGTAPVPIVLLESSNLHYPNKNWFVEFRPGTYFVRFTRQNQLVFRLDVVLSGEETIDTLLSKIGAYCFDQTTLGYPFPLQNIHDAVRISEMERDECFAYFKDEYRKAGLNARVFEEIFQIYHDQLDIISFGR
jgi:hypothetical protein